MKKVSFIYLTLIFLGITLSIKDSFSQGLHISDNPNLLGDDFIENALVENTVKTTDPFICSQDNPDSVVGEIKHYKAGKTFSFLLKVGFDANLTYPDEYPMIFDAGFRLQWKMKFYEIGIGPDIWYSPGNDYYYEHLEGYLSINNNFYFVEKEEVASFISVEFGKDIYWNNLESDYAEFSLTSGGGAILNVGLGLRFGKYKKGHLEFSWRGRFYGFYDEYEQCYGHVGIGYAL